MYDRFIVRSEIEILRFFDLIAVQKGAVISLVCIIENVSIFLSIPCKIKLIHFDFPIEHTYVCRRSKVRTNTVNS